MLYIIQRYYTASLKKKNNLKSDAVRFLPIKTKKRERDRLFHQFDNTGLLFPSVMAIAHVATEYVFSDFLLKDPTEAKYRGVRLELAVDKIVTLLAVGLPLFLISLAFAQEVSVGELLDFVILWGL